MNLRQWSKSEIEYGRRLVNSGLAGARFGRETFLHGRSLDPFLNASFRNAWLPAVVGACVGVIASGPPKGRASVGKVLAWAVLGGAVGFTAGVVWETRRLTASVASGVVNNVGKTLDEHWFEKHPIDYA